MSKRRKRGRDPRINARYPVWLVYLFMFAMMLALVGGQALITFLIEPIASATNFVIANVGLLYWSLAALGFCVITATIMRRRFDMPIEKISKAARRVAAGDFSVRIAPIRKDGKKDRIEVMFEDFNRMARELGSIEMLTSDFIANVSHEIKTPLTSIQSYAMAMRKNGMTEQQREEYIDTIIAASERLNALVANVLRLSKLENQAIAPALEEYDLCAQLAECAVLFEEQWESKRITFSAQMDDKAMICSDRSILEIVWNNLLSNALKFTEPGGCVALTQSTRDGLLTVTITDTGCGMDEDTMHRIFDKFYQGDTSHAQEGNGLGLALAMRGVKLLGGDISVTSTPGKGSAFTVTLQAKA